MRTRRLVSFLLGAWMASSMLLVFIQNENLRAVTPLLENTRNPLMKTLASIGQVEAQASVRYIVSEMNRAQTETFEWLQLADLVLIAGLLLMSQHGGKWSVLLGCLLALLALTQRFVFTPEVARLARAIELTPLAALAPERSRYFAFQTAYELSRIAMWAAGVLLALRMTVGSTLRQILMRDLDSLEAEDAALRASRRGR